MERIRPDARRIRRDIERLARLVAPDEPPFTRRAFSEQDRKARALVRRIMEQEVGLAVRVDAAGNLIGRRGGRRQGPVIMTGSHIDTVRGGGRFDGVAGVVAALEVCRRLGELQVAFDHPLEVVVFTAEEPSPFGFSTIGSRAMAGLLDEKQLAHTDERRRSLAEAISELGGSPQRLEEARRPAGSIHRFFELHIEQGPVLWDNGARIGAVTGIVGIQRYLVGVLGRPDHAGTTPMDVRRDALAAASEIVLAVERVCSASGGMVGTVGKLDIVPNAANVVPGEVLLDMEIRALDGSRIRAAAEEIRAAAREIAGRRGVELRWPAPSMLAPVVFEEALTGEIERLCRELDLPCWRLPSMAGHDTSNLARLAPAAMVFIPSRDGRSHCAEEWSRWEDVAAGAEVLGGLLRFADRQ